MPASNHVLVVDDEVPIAELVAEVLREEGYTVRIAHDGASALLDISMHCPGLVILDVAMPVLVGDELLRYLRRNGYDTLPVIMMTAGANPEVYYAHGATEVLPKPFDLNVLVDKVTTLLSQEAHTIPDKKPN